MRRVPITVLRRSATPIWEWLIRGETVELTRNGRVIAALLPSTATEKRAAVETGGPPDWRYVSEWMTKENDHD